MKKLITILLLLTPLLSIGMVKDTTWKPVAIMYQNEYGQYAGKWIKGADIQIPTNPESPVALVGDDKTIPYNQSSIILDGSSSYSPGGDNLTYYWSLEMGNSVSIINPNAATTTATGLYSGDYVFKLTVTDQHSRTNDKELHIHVEALPSYVYYVVDSALFNFTPAAQNINGYTDVVGDPSSSVLSATSSNGITVSTVSTSNWGANPDSSSSAMFLGMPYTAPTDPFNYIDFDSAAIYTGFENYNSEYQTGVYNIEVSGLDPDSRYQFIITGSKYDPGVTGANTYGSRTRYQLSDGQVHNMNTVFATSRDIRFDTIQPDESGIAKISVTGQSTSYSGGSVGIISALKIYEISKDQGDGITYGYRHFYDTLYINDGYRDRLCVVAPPYHYDPQKSYPILMYFGGGESAVEDGDWDPEVAVTEGAGFAIQHYKGNVYGIDASGDTTGFIILIPQNLLTVSNSESFNNPTVVQTILTKFKSRTKYNYNSDLYIGGFSRGAQTALNYIMQYPNSVKAAYLASPYSSIASAPSLASVKTFAQGLTSSSVKVYMMNRPDFTQPFTGDVIDTLDKYAPDNTYSNFWNRGHSGFAWEWTMDTTNNYASQNVYDWLVNPSKGNPSVAKFVLDFSGGTTDGWTNIQNSRYNNQSVTDANTGITLSTVTANWGNTTGAPLGNHIPVFGLIEYDYDRPDLLYANSGYGTRNTGPYSSNGPNLTLSNLTPNHSYTIWFDGYGAYNVENYGVMYYDGGQKQIKWKQNHEAERSRMKRIDVMSDASGKVDMGFYTTSEGDGKAYLNYLVVRKN